MTNNLIEALEKAEGPCRELDAAIFNVAEHLHFPSKMIAYQSEGNEWFAPEWRIRFEKSEPKKTDETLPYFTHSIDAALTLVLDGWSWIKEHHFRYRPPKMFYLIRLFDPDYFERGKSNFYVRGEDCLNFCIAALRAMGDDDEG